MNDGAPQQYHDLIDRLWEEGALGGGSSTVEIFRNIGYDIEWCCAVFGNRMICVSFSSQDGFQPEWREYTRDPSRWQRIHSAHVEEVGVVGPWAEPA